MWQMLMGQKGLIGFFLENKTKKDFLKKKKKKKKCEICCMW